VTPVVLVALILIAAVLALLGRGLFLGYPPARFRGAVLGAKEQAIVAACADALFPQGGAIPLSGTEAGVVRWLDEHMRELPAPTRMLVRLMLQFVELGPWIFGPRCARFTRLDPRERIAALKDMSQSRVYFRRVAFLSLRTLLSMGYLANESVAQRIGIRTSPSPRPGALIPPRQVIV
jgi:hypothetical protein